MSKIAYIRGWMKTLGGMMAEDFREMDHKILRIGISIAVFIVWAIFWFYFFRNTSPFGF